MRRRESGERPDNPPVRPRNRGIDCEVKIDDSPFCSHCWVRLPETARCVNGRTGVVLAHHLIPAFDSSSRRTGLLKHGGSPHGSAMIIAPSNAIHTFFMKIPDRRRVRRPRWTRAEDSRGGPPWRISAALRALCRDRAARRRARTGRAPSSATRWSFTRPTAPPRRNPHQGAPRPIQEARKMFWPHARTPCSDALGSARDAVGFAVSRRKRREGARRAFGISLAMSRVRAQPRDRRFRGRGGRL